MKRRTVRLICRLLCCALIFTTVPAAVFAADGEKTGITEAEVTVAAPVGGNVPAGAVSDDTRFTVANTFWEPPEDTFAAGTVYGVLVVLEAGEGYQFTADTAFRINGAAANIVTRSEEEAKIALTFPEAAAGEEQKEKLSIASMDVTLSGTSFAYTGSCIRPAVTVEGPDMTLVEGTDYEVTFSANRYVGTARAVITGIGACEGQVVKTFRINPAKVTVSKLTKPVSGRLKLTWKKHSTQTTGFQIQYSTSSTFKSAKTVTVSSRTATAKTISSLKKGKKYYVRIRAYKTVSGVRYYSSWSAKKSLRA